MWAVAIVAFLLGVVAALIALAWGILAFLSVSEAAIETRLSARASSAAAAAERDAELRAVQEDSVVRPSASAFTPSGDGASVSDRGGKGDSAAARAVSTPQPEVMHLGEMRLSLPKDVDLQRRARRWLWCVLKSNMLFCYSSEKAARAQIQPASESDSSAASRAPQPPEAVLLLDGVNAEPAKRRREKKTVLLPNGPEVLVRGRAIWKPKNPLILQAPNGRELWQGESEVWAYFRTGREAEAWFPRFERAASLRARSVERMLAPDMKGTARKSADSIPKRSSTVLASDGDVFEQHWSYLTSKLHNRDPVVAPDFASALANRIFWDLHDKPFFVEFVRYKIRRKIEQAREDFPSVLRSVDLTYVDFGPALPTLDAAQLVEIDRDGKVVIDIDICYSGGLRVGLDIVLAVPKPMTFLTSSLRKLRGTEHPSDATQQHFLIPIRVSAVVRSLQGRVRLIVNAPPADNIWIGFMAPPVSDIKVDYSMGGDGRKITMQQLPRLAKLASAGLRMALAELLVFPNMEDIELPKFPRKKKIEEHLLSREKAHPEPETTTETALRNAQNDIIFTEEVPEAALAAAIDSTSTELFGAIDQHIDALMHRRHQSMTKKSGNGSPARGEKKNE